MIFGYAVGLDLTRRDLQAELKRQARPWCIAKAFDASAPISSIVPAIQAGDIDKANISLKVNGEVRQQGCIDQLIWNIAEVIAEISKGWTLQPGDLIYTGTPAGAAALKLGDHLEAEVTGLPLLRTTITA